MSKILYVDDARSMRRLVDLVLTPDFDVSLAADGREGLALAQQQNYDVIISDVNMPNMTGLQLLEALRQLPAYQFTPILMLTTEASDDLKRQGKRLGATGWIVKPFNPEKLSASIKKVLS